MPNGTIAKVDLEKGFGFISQNNGPDLFFHRSAVNGKFESLSVGQAVQFEPDPSAEKPRAKLVLPSTGGQADRDSNPKQSGRQSGVRRNSRQDDFHRRSNDRGAPTSGGRRFESQRDQPPRIPKNAQFGHVIRLYRRDKIGRISPDAGGKEVYFDPRALVGERFGQLEIGQYVQFAIDQNTVDDEIPTAFFVTPADRERKETIGTLARHPRARRKKPSWR